MWYYKVYLLFYGLASGMTMLLVASIWSRSRFASLFLVFQVFFYFLNYCRYCKRIDECKNNRRLCMQCLNCDLQQPSYLVFNSNPLYFEDVTLMTEK